MVVGCCGCWLLWLLIVAVVGRRGCWLLWLLVVAVVGCCQWLLVVLVVSCCDCCGCGYGDVSYTWCLGMSLPFLLVAAVVCAGACRVGHSDARETSCFVAEVSQEILVENRLLETIARIDRLGVSDVPELNSQWKAAAPGRGVFLSGLSFRCCRYKGERSMYCLKPHVFKKCSRSRTPCLFSALRVSIHAQDGTIRWWKRQRQSRNL